MSKTPFFICLIPAFLIGCTHSERAGGDSANRGAAVASTDADALTRPTQSRAPENTEGGPAGPEVRSWFVNADRTVWMLDDARVAGERTKIGWFRPARTALKVTGRRLDAAAPPLSVETSPSGEEYRHQFQPSIMIFPTAGRWEITARAAQSEARFVVDVQPART
jgi:hypothetical protein